MRPTTIIACLLFPVTVAACGQATPVSNAPARGTTDTVVISTQPTAPALGTTPDPVTSTTDLTTSTHAAHSAHGEASADVEIRLLAFRPESITVGTGQTITWSQMDSGFHTVTSGDVIQESSGVKTVADGTFDSGQIAEGATFELTLSTVGTYPYFCALHPATMRGSITVT